MNEDPSQSPIDDLRKKVAKVPAAKKWAMLCYIPVFNVLTCTLCSVRMVNDEYCRFHARQGLILFALWFFTVFVALISPTLSLMLWGVTLLLHGAGLFIAYNAKSTKIPLLGQFALKIPEYYLFMMLTGKTPDVVSGKSENDATPPSEPSEPAEPKNEN